MASLCFVSAQTLKLIIEIVYQANSHRVWKMLSTTVDHIYSKIYNNSLAFEKSRRVCESPLDDETLGHILHRARSH